MNESVRATRTLLKTDLGSILLPGDGKGNIKEKFLMLGNCIIRSPKEFDGEISREDYPDVIRVVVQLWNGGIWLRTGIS